MKKAYFIYILLVIVILSSCTNKYNIIYKPGKDTHMLFGDGTYQLLTSVTYSDNGDVRNKMYGLFNSEYKIPVLFDVSDYKKEKEIVYFKGTDERYNQIFIILNIGSNSIKYCNISGEDPQFTCANDLINENKLIIIKDFNEFSEEEKSYYYSLN